MDGIFDHPARYTFVVCRKENNSISAIGGSGSFPLDRNKCKNFLGKFDAEIIEELDESHLLDSDYYKIA